MTIDTHDRIRASPGLERYASGDWLTPRLMAFAALAMIAGTVISLGLLVLTATGTVDAQGRPIGTDFSSFWTAGRLALEGRAAAAYDWTAHAAMQRQTHGVDLFFPWSYPPFFLAVAAAITTLPYLAAWLIWQGTTTVAALAVVQSILPTNHPPWLALLLALGFPAVLICWGHGQTGFLTAALLAGGALALPARPILAGVLFGLLAYKPQFGLLIPFVLIAGGSWRAFAAAALTVSATFGLTLALWGWPVWEAFFESVTVTRTLVFETGDTGFEKFQSAFAWARLWYLPSGLAYGLQALVTASALCACVWIWRGRVDVRLKAAALLVGTLLSSPYMLDYDLVVLGMAIALLAAHGMQTGFLRWEKTLLAWAWFMPAIARTVAGATFLPIGFLTLLGIFVWIVMRVRASETAPARVTRWPAAA